MVDKDYHQLNMELAEAMDGMLTFFYIEGVGVGKDVDNATMRWSWCCLIRNSSV